MVRLQSEVFVLGARRLDLKPSESDFHFSIDVCGITCSKAVSPLVEHRFVEIMVEPCKWTPITPVFP
jgi:hypothetical protein